MISTIVDIAVAVVARLLGITIATIVVLAGVNVIVRFIAVV